MTGAHSSSYHGNLKMKIRTNNINLRVKTSFSSANTSRNNDAPLSDKFNLINSKETDRCPISFHLFRGYKSQKLKLFKWLMESNLQAPF